MREASIVLVALPQANGQVKPRPALVLRAMPPFGDLLVAGISSQLQQLVAGFDELLAPTVPVFGATGLRVPSIVRLGFLTVVSPTKILGELGSITPELHQQLLARLSDYLTSNQTVSPKV